MVSNRLELSMNLRLFNSFANEMDKRGIIYLVDDDNHDDNLNFSEELMTSATIVGMTSAILTSIVAVIKHVIPSNKKVEILIGEKRYVFENYSLSEIEELIKLSEEKIIVKVK